MTVEIGPFIRIHRDPMTETGLSALEGSEIRSVDDLPEHLVEVHVFSDGTYASTFIEGIRLVGLGNSMALTRQTGPTHTNQVVLIARFDQPRLDGATPLECLRVVHHERDFEADHQARKAWMDNHHRQQDEERNRWQEHARSDGGPIAELLEAAGYKTKVEAYAGSTSVKAWRMVQGRWEARAGDHFTASVPHEKGEVTVNVSGYDLVQGKLDLLDRYREAAAARGVTFGPEGPGDSDLELVVPRDGREVAIAVGTLEACLEDCARIKTEAYLAEFRAGMKVTAARRRLFAAGREHGIRSSIHRNSEKARAGGEEIGPTEIADLLRMGWIERTGGKGAAYVVTDAALEAAGLSRDGSSDLDAAAFRRKR